MAKTKTRVTFLPNPPKPGRDGYDERDQRALDRARETGEPQLLGTYDTKLTYETCWALPSNQIVVEVEERRVVAEAASL